MRAEVSLSINGFNFNIIKVTVKMLRVLRLSQTFTHRLVNFSLLVFLFVLVEVLVHPGLAEFGVAAVLLDAAKPGFEHVVDALLGVPLRRSSHLDVEAGVGRVRLPLHHLVLLEQHDPLGGLQGSGRLQRVGPVGVGVERDLGLAHHLPIPVVGEGVIEPLPVGVAGAGVLLDVVDVAVDVDGDEPEVVAARLGDLLGGRHSVVVPGVLEGVLVLEHGPVKDDPRRLGSAAPQVQDQGAGCNDS